jgi:pimeloyl-ACP methyl ester carboxylesterase
MESMATFGEDNGLIGTVTTPVTLSSAHSNIGFVFFNAGIVPRVGPHRVNVKIARALAEKGIPSIRFDLGGLGDSRRGSGVNATSHAAQAVLDIRSAMDALTTAAHVDKFVLCAICSGTVHSFDTAAADPRVAGLFLLDTYMYSTPRSRINYLALRVKRRLGDGSAIKWTKT